jgi:hypothetical protein
MLGCCLIGQATSMFWRGRTGNNPIYQLFDLITTPRDDW